MESVHHARHITQQGKHEIEPKLASQTDGTKHTERWQYSGKDHLHGTRNHGSHEHFFLRADIVQADWFLDNPLASPLHGMQILYHSARLPQTPHLWKA
jgi:hypothetical protein